MRLTTKGRYAVTALLDMALHAHESPIGAADVAARQKISLSYLEQLFGRLRRAGLIESVRGPGGGYSFQRDPKEISISDIVSAVGEGVDATRCHGAADCQDGTQCLTHDLWSELSDQIDAFLKDITLAQLVARRDVQRLALAQDTRVASDLIDARHL